MRYGVCFLCCIMLATGNAHADDKTAYTKDGNGVSRDAWNQSDKDTKDLYLMSVREGMRELCLLTDCQEHLWKYLEHKQDPCIMKDFDSIYGQNIDIKFPLLYALSIQKCLGENTEERFLYLVEEFREK